MATPSEVKAGLDAASDLISGAIRMRAAGKAQLLAARNQLAALATQLADVISTINGYTPTGAFETLSKDELSKLTSEFQALKAALEAELNALGVTYS